MLQTSHCLCSHSQFALLPMFYKKQRRLSYSAEEYENNTHNIYKQYAFSIDFQVIYQRHFSCRGHLTMMNGEQIRILKEVVTVYLKVNVPAMPWGLRKTLKKKQSEQSASLIIFELGTSQVQSTHYNYDPLLLKNIK